MKTFFKQIFQDISGQFSSKRTIVFGSFLLLVIAFFADLFWKTTITQFIWDGVYYIVLTGMGLVTLEPAASSIFKRKSDGDENK